MAIVETRNVWRGFGSGETRIEALRGVNIVITRGEFVAVMGPSGSGKSTLLQILGGLDRPDQGAVLIDGVDLARLPDRRLTELRRRRIGFVFQFFNLMPTLNAAENIGLPLLLDNKSQRMIDERANRLLDLVGLLNRRDHTPGQLSGGQQQRVALARALVTEPAVLLADEPTGNLDSRTAEEMVGLLRRSSDELQQTIVMVTHDPRIAAYADRIIFLKDGTVVDQANLEQPVDAEISEVRS